METGNSTDIATNINRFLDNVCRLETTALRTDRRASAKSGFNKLAATCINEHLFFVSSAVLADSEVILNRHLRVAPKLYQTTPTPHFFIYQKALNPGEPLLTPLNL
jgi:hypothetical protein